MVGRHISNDLKEMALSMSLQGLRDSEVQEHTGISVRTLKRLRSTHRKTGGTVSHRPPLTGQQRVLTVTEVKFLCDCVERRPDIALTELQTDLLQVCSTEASLKTIVHSLQLEGYTMKTVTEQTLERNKQDREEFKALVHTNFRPEQLVFADESYFNRFTTKRPYTWSRRGERARRFELSLCGMKYSILPAISLDGVLYLEVTEDAITEDFFRQFVQGLLPHMNKWPLPNSVLVIDNAKVHKAAGIRSMVEETGARLLYLPSNSPDFNPIESAFPKIKEWLHTNHDHVNQELESCTARDVFSKGTRLVAAEHVKRWYKACGYNVRL